jgi:hypothetical protein
MNTEVKEEKQTLTPKEKLAICKQCEKFNNTIKVCGVCLCFMPAKTRLPGQTCPLNKW